MSENEELPGCETCVTRFFPLPDLVMFPHAVQMLHVFEPRYVALLEDALADDQVIAMAVLAPGWQADYDGRPAVHPTICLGRVMLNRRLPDGRFNVLLSGTRRARILEELEPSKPFREARVALLDDHYPPSGADHRLVLHRRLLDSFRQRLPNSESVCEQLRHLFSSKNPLGTLADVMSFFLPLAMEDRLRLLDELDVDRRAELLLERLEQPSPGVESPLSPLRRLYGSKFSDN